MILERPDIKPVWTNCSDSLLHAGKHFIEYANLKEDKENPWILEEKTHHAKWALLSVGHAADCYLKIIAKELDPNSTLFKSKKRLITNPSIPVTIKYLKKHYGNTVPHSLKTLFQVLGYVHEQRNQIVHHMIPEELGLSVSVAAWAHLAILKSIGIRYDQRLDDIDEVLIGLIRSPRLEPRE